MSRKVAYYGIFSSLAILMGYIEFMIPISFAVPGMKLGLANSVTIMALYIMDTKSAFFISLIRVTVSALLFNTFAGLLYSLSGAILSLCIMALFKHIKSISIVGISILGGISHNIGQLVTACAVVNNIKLMYNLPLLLISGAITGFLIGVSAKNCIKYLK